MASVLASEGTPGSEVEYASNVELVLHVKAFCWCFGAVLVEEHPLLGPHAFAEEQLLVGLHALTKQLIVTSGCTRAAAWNLRGVTSCRAKVAARATHLTPSGDGVGGRLLAPEAKLVLRWSPKVPFDLPIAIGASGGAASGRHKITGKGGIVRGAHLIGWSARVGPTKNKSAVEQTLVGVSVHFSQFGQHRSV